MAHPAPKARSVPPRMHSNATIHTQRWDFLRGCVLPGNGASYGGGVPDSGTGVFMMDDITVLLSSSVPSLLQDWYNTSFLFFLSAAPLSVHAEVATKRDFQRPGMMGQ